ncbi:MAG TPA: spermidine/putrescine ABC transporter substrate-binding protein [Longimicrobiales bacterium]|nr:spermidine/putrescine ABC transporter substrate-binding protein [Longimicrobiales bacterium]
MRVAALTATICAVVLATACGTPERPEFVEAYGLRVETARLGNTLRMFNWPDYMDPELLEEFESTYGVRVIVDYYDTNEAMIAKLESGGAGQYDVVVASDYAIETLLGAGMLEPLDHSNIPNIDNLDPRFRDLPFDPGNRHSVAYQWGTSGLGIRTDRISGIDEDALGSWRIVFDPDVHPGPFAMMSDGREVIAAALFYLGYSANTTNPDELRAAEELLIAQRPRVLTYAPFATGRDLLAAGDVVVAHNFSGDILMARDEVEAIRYVIPREGAILWTDNLAVPVGARAKYAAEVFINFLLDAEVGGRLSNFTRYASPNAAARAYIDEDLLSDPSVYPDEEVAGRLELLRDLGPDRALYEAIWTRVRAGN